MMKRMMIAALAVLLALPPHVAASASAAEQGMQMLPVEQFADWYYSNPSGVTDIGDPLIFHAEGAYWLIATSSSSGYRIWRSEDLTQWQRQEQPAYQRSKESWSRGNFWAPEVYFHQGRYLLFYSARAKGMWDSMRIGIAASERPEGPYIDLKNEPLFDPGHSVIDASFFVDDDGTPYLYYSRDCSENVVDGVHQSHSYGVRLKDDLSGIDGEPVALTKPDQEWEMNSGPEWLWNEGQIVQKHDGRYWLFYSANYYASKEYGVGVAAADSPLGPYEKVESNPLLSFVEQGGETLVSGPGHNSFLTTPGGDRFMVYHSHTDPKLGGDDRQMCLDRTGFRADGTPFVNGPTLFPQLKPLELIGVRNLLIGATAASDDVQAARYLIDGDYGISPGSEGLAFREGQEMFTLDPQAEAEAIIAYAPPGASGKGCLLLNGTHSIEFDLDQLSSLPGACLRYHFEPLALQTVSIELDDPTAALSELIVLGR